MWKHDCFVKEMHQCEVSEAVQKLLSFHRQNIAKNNTERPRFHLHENSLIHHENARETGTRIIAAKQSLKDLILCRYVRQRNIADKWCFEVRFVAGEKEKIYRAAGFKNNAGDNEVSNGYFRESVSKIYLLYR